MKYIVLMCLAFFQLAFTKAQNGAWDLVWTDEFDYNGLPDSTKWSFETKGNATGWGNNEKQLYTAYNTKNAKVNNGTLKITAIKEQADGKEYTSARLSTAGKANFKYGKIEVRAKLPAGKGTWPAIWMLGENITTTKWPDCGEIDIMEHVGYEADSIHGTVHTAAYNHILGTQKGKSVYIKDPYTAFHNYAIEWTEEKIDFLIDGMVYYTVKNEHKTSREWPFDQAHYLILNLAVGGNWGGKYGVDDLVFPAIMEIDYVRVYQQAPKDLGSLIKNRQVVDSNLILPPSWAFGMLYGAYTNQQETIDRVKQIIQKDYPIDAYWIDSWFWDHANKGKGPDKYIDFIADNIGYPDRKAMWKFLGKNNIKGGFWTWDCIQETGNEAAFNEFKEKGFFSSVYQNTNSWHNNSTTTAMFDAGGEKKATPTGNIDFKNPEAVAHFKKRMKHFFDEGADFIKLDRTSAIEVCKPMFEMSQEFGKETKGRGFILSHTGGQESPEYKKYPTKWTDDTRSDWNIEHPLVKFDTWVPNVALKENIAMFTDLSKKTSDIPFLTNDMGGFDMGKTDKPEEELFIRWMQFSMFNPIVEVFSQPENPTANMAWNYSIKADTLFRNYAHLRMKLFPYIYSYAHRSRIEGKHMLGKFRDHMYQFTFGDELLVAPVYERGAITQKLFLPEGKWVNYWSGDVVQGNKSHTVVAPIEQIPMFVKAGAIIPYRNYAASVEKGNNKTLTLSVYANGDSEFYLIEDDGSSNDYLKGDYAATLLENKHASNKTQVVIHAVNGTYKGMPAKRNWKIQLKDDRKPLSIKCNGKNVKFVIEDNNTVQFELNRKKVKQNLLIEIFYS